MAKTPPFFTPPSLLLVSAVIFQLSAVTSAVGINYGTLGNLPPPQQVVDFIKTKTIFDSVKIFDANPDILRALAGSGIHVTITVPNGNIPALANLENARQWVAANVLPFHQTTIKYICVGNEILLTKDMNLISNLVPAMQSLTEALKASGLTDTKVTTPHAFTVGYNQNAPSESRFNDDQKDFFAKVLEFHRQAKSPFMISAYPYFMVDPNNVNFAIFGPSSHGLMDTHTQHTYNNMFDAIMDATYSAMSALGYGDVDISVGETGWPSVCDAPWCTPENAANYNRNIIKRAQNIGTPLMPNRHIDIFIFALFNEDGKPGPNVEKHWGLFKPDFSPVYDAGVLRGGTGGTPPIISHKGKWCVAKQEATNAQLQANIDWVCSQGIDCKTISPGGTCFDNNNMKTRASFVMNVYYQSKGCSEDACNFSGSGMVTSNDPSTSSCVVVANGSHMGNSIEPPRKLPKWCVPKEGTSDAQLQANIDWLCDHPQSFVLCKPIFPGPDGSCFRETLRTRATFVMSYYFMSRGVSWEACNNFNGSGIITYTNPSTVSCFINAIP
ncbi:hypothetical protein EUTSA_v10017897mg [Eutrema salsugineum]|uniref:glucan endo-1,3-beta-D-glucosidase n=1 Tax=Eutrema salsugineum TaxID=72664 RepID=V4MJ85_EUTSA|nr:glucan endo-1,3-beta-glucosidase [Eutrema salsugineum]ESQ52643.1 hypothetical protein EUTSA_v10017897mg [Eutrema salsugineum]